MIIIAGAIGGYVILSDGGANENQDGNTEKLVLGPENNGSVLTVERNTEVTVELPENPTAGYRWKFEVGGTFAKLLDNIYVPPENQNVGEGGIRKVELKIVGDGELTMQYVRDWDENIEKEFSVTFYIKK